MFCASGEHVEQKLFHYILSTYHLFRSLVEIHTSSSVLLNMGVIEVFVGSI
jgi:hypothetical protein